MKKVLLLKCMLARKKATLHKGQGQYSVCSALLDVTGELEGFVEFQSCISMATKDVFVKRLVVTSLSRGSST